ncbi:MAG: winged helix-turn-helix domain-containing protein [Eubacterium sp.]|nr:winged helix-turn-helix domain-containing protein [Eubacterium sp.]
MSAVYITMLGEFSVSYRDKTVSEKEQRGTKMWTLLQYLIAHREREIPQNELIELLWTEKSRNPANALKTLIHRLRKCLSEILPEGTELILNNGSSYRFAPNIDCVIDSGEFARLCQVAEDDTLSRVRRANTYKHALELYRGDYLVSRSGETWVIPITVYFHTLYTATVDKYVRLLYPMGKFAEIVRVCEHGIIINPTDEKMHIQLIRAMTAMGEYTQAAKQYEYIKTLLLEQYGAPPSTRLTELYETTVKPRNETQENLDAVVGDLSEGVETGGGYYCEYEVFKYIFRANFRESKRHKRSLSIGMFTLTDEGGAALNDNKMLGKAMSKLSDCIGVSLRMSDVYTRYSRCQYIIMLPEADGVACEQIKQRILNKFRRFQNKNKIYADFRSMQVWTDE